jgi:hypothetical protein
MSCGTARRRRTGIRTHWRKQFVIPPVLFLETPFGLNDYLYGDSTMWSFCGGWQLKMGIVALVFACIFMVGLVRSQVVEDCVEFRTPSQSERHLLVSVDEFIILEVALDATISWAPKWYYFSLDGYRGIDDLDVDVDEWYLRLSHFGIGKAQYDRGTGTGIQKRVYLYASYWLIIAPLTLVAAYLLRCHVLKLSKSKRGQAVLARAGER